MRVSGEGCLFIAVALVFVCTCRRHDCDAENRRCERGSRQRLGVCAGLGLLRDTVSCLTGGVCFPDARWLFDRRERRVSVIGFVVASISRGRVCFVRVSFSFAHSAIRMFINGTECETGSLLLLLPVSCCGFLLIPNAAQPARSDPCPLVSSLSLVVRFSADGASAATWTGVLPSAWHTNFTLASES